MSSEKKRRYLPVTVRSEARQMMDDLSISGEFYKSNTMHNLRAAGVIDADGNNEDPDQDKLNKAVIAIAEVLDSVRPDRSEVEYVIGMVAGLSDMSPGAEVVDGEGNWLACDSDEEFFRHKLTPYVCKYLDGVIYNVRAIFGVINGNIVVSTDLVLPDGRGIRSTQPFSGSDINLGPSVFEAAASKIINGVLTPCPEGEATHALLNVPEGALDKLGEFYDLQFYEVEGLGVIDPELPEDDEYLDTYSDDLTDAEETSAFVGESPFEDGADVSESESTPDETLSDGMRGATHAYHHVDSAGYYEQEESDENDPLANAHMQ